MLQYPNQSKPRYEYLTQRMEEKAMLFSPHLSEYLHFYLTELSKRIAKLRKSWGASTNRRTATVGHSFPAPPKPKNRHRIDSHNCPVFLFFLFFYLSHFWFHALHSGRLLLHVRGIVISLPCSQVGRVDLAMRPLYTTSFQVGCLSSHSLLY